MSYADIMLYGIEFDCLRERFAGIIDYSKLKETKGFKLQIVNDFCILDPPCFYQGIKRWYYNQSHVDFEKFLVNYKRVWDEFLNKINKSKLVSHGNTHTRHFVGSIVFYVLTLARACNLCRGIYPLSEPIHSILLLYYHDLSKWVQDLGY